MTNKVLPLPHSYQSAEPSIVINPTISEGVEKKPAPIHTNYTCPMHSQIRQVGPGNFNPTVKLRNVVEKLTTSRIVAIGASAGGLEAFQRLIENLPCDTGMAFVLLTHILRGSKSLLPEILARSTNMPVIQAQEGMSVRANHI